MKYNDLTSYYDFVIENHRHFSIGEVVAVAQRYSEIPMEYLLSARESDGTSDWIFQSLIGQSHGWTNKQGVLASLMPRRIRITGVKVECVQDISDEGCLREGIEVEDWRNDYRWGLLHGLLCQYSRTGFS